MKNRRVVVIDDDKKFLDEMEAILNMGGYDPVVISDTPLGADKVIQARPDIVLLELSMPHKSGFEMTSTMTRIFEAKKTPIIAMSSFFKDEFIWLLNFCGIKTWLKKPFHPLNIFWAIENEIEKSNQWDRKRSLAGAEVVI